MVRKLIQNSYNSDIYKLYNLSQQPLNSKLSDHVFRKQHKSHQWLSGKVETGAIRASYRYSFFKGPGPTYPGVM